MRVAIVGTGISGLTLALRLQQLGMDTTVFGDRIEALAAAGALDRDMASAIEKEMWSYAGPVTAWTNGFLGPPAPHVLELFATAASNQSVADAFTAGFADNVRLAMAVSSPEATAAFVGAVLEPVPA